MDDQLQLSTLRRLKVSQAAVTHLMQSTKVVMSSAAPLGHNHQMHVHCTARLAASEVQIQGVVECVLTGCMDQCASAASLQSMMSSCME